MTADETIEEKPEHLCSIVLCDQEADGDYILDAVMVADKVRGSAIKEFGLNGPKPLCQNHARIYKSTRAPVAPPSA